MDKNFRALNIQYCFATQAQTAVNNLVQGTYQFQLNVTDNQGATGTDTVVITVNACCQYSSRRKCRG